MSALKKMEKDKKALETFMDVETSKLKEEINEFEENILALEKKKIDELNKKQAAIQDNSCRPKLSKCPLCRTGYKGAPKRHRYAEKTSEELLELKKEKDKLQTNEILGSNSNC